MVSTPCPLCEKEPKNIFKISAIKLSTGGRLCSDCAGDLGKAIPGQFSYKKYTIEEAKAAIKKYKEEAPAREVAQLEAAASAPSFSKAPPRRATCPHCRSIHIMPVGRKHKSYSFKKAAAGAVLFTPAVGALVGFTGGTGKHEFYCQDCGKIFKR